MKRNNLMLRPQRVRPKYFSQTRIPRCTVLDGSPLLQLRRSFILPLKQLCSSSIALMVNAPPSSFSRPPPDPPPYEYPPLEALSPVAPPEPPDPPDAVPLVSSSDSPFPCGHLFPVVCRSSPYQFVEGSILRSFPDLLPRPPVTVLQLLSLRLLELVGTRVVWGTLNLGSMVLVVNVPMARVSFGSTFVASERFLPAVCRSFIIFSLVFGVVILCILFFVVAGKKPSDICYLLNMILTGIVLPVVLCLELCLFPIFPLVWSELEAQELLVLKEFSSQLMLSSAVDAVSVILWITLVYHFGWFFVDLLYPPLIWNLSKDMVLNLGSTIRNYPSSFCITIQIHGNLNRKITLKTLKPQQNIHDPSNWSLSHTSVYHRC
ncbi:hypothetical protein HID58_015849, partial [Brassica napus]